MKTFVESIQRPVGMCLPKPLLTLFVVIVAVSAMTSCTPHEDPVDPTPQTQVPDELVGAWDDGSLDFVRWENYPAGYWAGRNAVPTREAMVFQKNGEARFYRYEHAGNLYEELIDCSGTVAFHGDGTFTFYPLRGRKRFHTFLHPEDDVDRALTSEELTQPKLAGKRAYVYDGSTTPPIVRITVPGSAPYNWYKKE
ncbi:hypothetical protein SAMN05421823_106239 [Catalinimonas alkaloidigena]|uniref:Uncharacterized protein n=1 Tax=Catalinimonas alkaloidigena TaxID=1075417 RepID=A0A1G9KT02_9BACT|nr:hypothetical protein [Catalinimonas alkaloidigena]SDL52415.1 hypothetical protein SAMN05421823_106239 [Catalinimonas alkaloidigena]